MSTTHTQHIVRRQRATVLVLTGALALWAWPTFAQSGADRLPDKDVKAIIEQVDHDRDKFEGNLDSKLKESVLRTANAEVKVSAVLQDYQDNVKKLLERFTADYAASAEVATVLTQAARFDRFMLESPATTKGRSEWDREAASLNRLAAAYGTTFPMPEGASVRRMNDKEVAEAAIGIAAAANRMKSDFDKVPDVTLPKADKAVIKQDLQLLVKQADIVKSRLNDAKPARSEVQVLVAQVATVQKFLDAHPSPTGRSDWQVVQTSLVKLQQVFGLPN